MIAENIREIKQEIGPNVTLVAVSKTKPAAMIREAYDDGHHIFGENKVQEMVSKAEELPEDIEWHLIGHLQTNKVKYIVPFVSMIHTVDRKKLMKEINRQAAKHNRVIECLVQVKIAEEDSKFGAAKEDIDELLDYARELEFVKITGLMGMATLTDNRDQIHSEFRELKVAFDRIKASDADFKWLSMGMTGDYKIALEEGSNMVRIGSAIFGERQYP